MIFLCISGALLFLFADRMMEYYLGEPSATPPTQIRRDALPSWAPVEGSHDYETEQMIQAQEVEALLANLE